LLFRTESDLEVRYNTVLQSKGNTTKVKKIVHHPKYFQSNNPFKIANDVAILHVQTPIDLSLKTVEPVCLPKANDDPADHQMLTVSGWGRLSDTSSIPEHLKTVDVPVVKRAHCNEQLLKIYKDAHLNVSQEINQDMFCAGFEQGGKGICMVRKCIFYHLDINYLINFRVILVDQLFQLTKIIYQLSEELFHGSSVFVVVPMFHKSTQGLVGLCHLLKKILFKLIIND